MRRLTNVRKRDTLSVLHLESASIEHIYHTWETLTSLLNCEITCWETLISLLTCETHTHHHWHLLWSLLFQTHSIWIDKGPISFCTDIEHNMTGVLLISSLPALHSLIEFNCYLIVQAAILDPDMSDPCLELPCMLTESVTASTSNVSS